MTEVRPYQPIGPGSGSSTSGHGRGRVLGCALGCLGLVVALFAMLWMFWWWMSRPGPQVATEPIVPEDAVAALRIEGLGEDEGFTELALEALIQFDSAARRVQEQQLPDNLRWMAALRGRKPRAKDLRKWLPREITVAVEAAPTTEDGYSVVTAVNLARYPRVVRFLVLRFFADGEGRRWEHRGQPLLHNGDTTIGFVGSTLLISDDVGATERAIDELVGAPSLGESEGEPGSVPIRGVEAARRIGDLAVSHPGPWDIHGGFVNEENVLAYAWWDVLDSGRQGTESGDLEIREDGKPVLDPGFEALARGVEASWMAIDFLTADEVRGVLAFRCRDAQAAQAWSAQVTADLERLRRDAADQGLGLEIVTTLAGERLDVELQATSIRAWLDGRIGDFMTALMRGEIGSETGSPGDHDSVED